MKTKQPDTSDPGSGTDVPERFATTLQRLRQIPPATLSRDLAPDILARIKAEAQRKAGKLTLWRKVYPLAAAATVALLLGVGWWMRYGVNRATVTALSPSQQAVLWLCRTQEPDGSWSTARWGGDKQFEVALTALSLMTVLDEGSASSEREAIVNRAVDFLVKQQGADGQFGGPFASSPYNQGIATLALIQAYRARRNDDLKVVVDHALAALCEQQHRDGGWGYRNEASPVSNLSLTLWQIEALRLAATVDWPGVRPNLARGLRWVASVADDDGTFGYRQQRDFPTGSTTLTAMGAMSVLGEATSQLVSPARRQAITAQVRRQAASAAPDCDYYREYFLAAALRTMEAEASRRSLQILQQNLIAQQVRQGPETGSWNADDRWSSAGGRVYATAMAAMSIR